MRTLFPMLFLRCIRLSFFISSSNCCCLLCVEVLHDTIKGHD
jgi:hypothetical protein